MKLRYEPLEHLPLTRPVDRIAYVKACCVGKRVLDLGAYDETEVEKPQHVSWRWLHGEIASVASGLLGVDASAEVRESGRIDTSVGTEIVYGDVADLAPIVGAFEPEVIVAGELVEHTPDTVGWMTRLRQSAGGARFVATTPNATSLINLCLALFSRENCHKDHLHVYSYKTLATVARCVGLSEERIVPYYYDPHLALGKAGALARPWLRLAERMVLRPVQYLFPLTSFGLILDGKFERD